MEKRKKTSFYKESNKNIKMKLDKKELYTLSAFTFLSKKMGRHYIEPFFKDTCIYFRVLEQYEYTAE